MLPHMTLLPHITLLSHITLLPQRAPLEFADPELPEAAAEVPVTNWEVPHTFV